MSFARTPNRSKPSEGKSFSNFGFNGESPWNPFLPCVSSSQQSIAKYHISKVDAEQPSVQSVVQTNLCQPTKHLKMMPGWYNQQDGPMDSNHTENGTNEAKTAAPPAAPPAVAPEASNTYLSEDCTSYRTWSADCGFGNCDVPSCEFFKRSTMLVAPKLTRPLTEDSFPTGMKK